MLNRADFGTYNAAQGYVCNAPENVATAHICGLLEMIDRLTATLANSRPYVETCADDGLPSPAADTLKNIDQLLTR